MLCPAFAQQKEPTPSDKDRQQTDAFVKKFHEAYDNHDAAALAALYTEDAIIVTPQGPVYGREAIEKWYADGFQQWHSKSHIDKVDQGPPHHIGTAGNEAWSNGEWSETIQGQNFGPIQIKGYWSNVTVREGDTWKIRMDTFNVSPAPATTTPSPTTTPSN